MARKHEAVEWLKAGLSPTQIAGKMGVTVSTVVGYLLNQVGEGRIQRSQIAFNIDPAIRAEVDRIVAARQNRGRECDRWYVRSYLHRKRWPNELLDEAEVYYQVHSRQAPMGDLYECIFRVETTLHSHVKHVLQIAYGDAWWRKGVSVETRARCAEALERDDEPANEPYCYTNFIDLKKIIAKEWRSFVPLLPAEVAKDKKQLESGLGRLNGIRNQVMHPAKGLMPSEETFVFVQRFLAFLDLDRWLVTPSAKKVNAVLKKILLDSSMST